MATITGKAYLKSKKFGKTKNDKDYLLVNLSEKVGENYVTYKFTLWDNNAKLYESLLKEGDKSNGTYSSFVAFSGYVKGIESNQYQDKTYTAIEIVAESVGIVPPKKGGNGSSSSNADAPKPVDLTDF